MNRQAQQKQWTAQEILDALNEYSQVLYDMGARKLGLFGSYVRGEQTPESDMDFVVMLARPSYDDYHDIWFFLQDYFGRKVDLVLEDGIKPRLRPYIMNEVIYVQRLQSLS